MKKIYFVVISLFMVLSINAQTKVNEEKSIRTIIDNGTEGVEITYNFPDLSSNNLYVEGTQYQKLYIKHFSSFADAGKPDLPAHTDLIAMPIGAKATIKIIESEIVEYENYKVFPALKPATDNVGGKEPEFEIDTDFYSKNITFPTLPVSITSTKYVRDMPIIAVRVNPVQYNPAQKKLYVYKSIKYKIIFSGSNTFVNANKHSDSFLKNYSNYFSINGKSVKQEIENSVKATNSKTSTTNKNYIIITTPEFAAAADSLAKWKKQLGYSVDIVSQTNWTSAQVKTAVHTRYSNWTPKPDYLTIIGDNEDVPGEALVSNSTNITTDLYYVCMGGVGDYTPDMAKGRISVSNATQAMMVVRKMINYERNPISDNTFYNNAIAAAYFQDDNTNGYATRRFAQTSEDIKQYLDGLGYTTERAYYTGGSITPTNWNLGNYSAGEALPSYLLKPGFPWDGDDTQIKNAINNGRFIVFHRDHGYEYGWGDPAFNIADVNALNNGDKLPVLFSINCLTGKFDETECFSEAFLREPDGGAVGVFGHAEVSYSGYNDGLALGLIDAIFPGLNANFTGYGDNSSTYTSHSAIYTMGDVANQGLLRMTESWGNNWNFEKYTHELFHYFGDPAMRIWTANPTTTPIIASLPTSILCSDTSLSISACSQADALATIYHNGHLISKTQLSSGSGTLYFNPFGTTNQNLIITISYQNSAPLISEVSVTGVCAYTPIADFTTANTNIIYCNGNSDTITILDDSYYNPTSWQWMITPNTFSYVNGTNANSENPEITFSDFGNYTVKLIVANVTGSDTITEIDYLTVVEECNFTMTSGDLYTCEGTFYDNNIYGNYLDNTDDTLTIYPYTTGNIVELVFNTFNIEIEPSCNYDYLEIFDGIDVNASQIGGRYCGTNSPGTVTANNPYGALTFVFHSDVNTAESGWEATINCINISSAPVSDFETYNTTSCNGEVSFTDLSINAPNSWMWYFGDGTTSTLQNPNHTYTTNGVYDVSLVSANIIGSDSIVKMGYVTVIFPDILSSTNDNICGPGNANLQATGMGTIHWYDNYTNGVLLATGNSFNTPHIDSTTTFYAEDRVIHNSEFGAKLTNSGNGGYINFTGIKGLYFDCINDMILISVKVYSNEAKIRNIVLLDDNFTTIYSQDFEIPAGESRVYLNWEISQGDHYAIYIPSQANLFGNTYGATYPYAISNKINITSSIGSSSLDNYDFFYDWEISEPNCYTILEPVTANVGIVSINDFTYSINGLNVNFYVAGAASTYLWTFGDGNTSTQQNPQHIYADYGAYTVSLIINDGSCVYTLEKDIYPNAINEFARSEINIYPNPANDYIIIESTNLATKVEEIQITDIYGRIVKTSLTQESTVKQSLDISNFRKGIYILNIKTIKGVAIYKLIKN